MKRRATSSETSSSKASGVVLHPPSRDLGRTPSGSQPAASRHARTCAHSTSTYIHAHMRLRIAIIFAGVLLVVDRRSHGKREMPMPRPRPCAGLVTWLKHELGTNDNGFFCKASNEFTLYAGPHCAWEKLPVLGAKLEKANKALKPVGVIDLSKATFSANPHMYFMALLDKLATVMDTALCNSLMNITTYPVGASIPAGQHQPLTGEAMFSTQFKWMQSGTCLELDKNVCMPWNRRKVKKARHMGVSKDGYLYTTLGDSLVAASPCKEYAHRIICLLFNGPPPPLGRWEVSHRCHNKECLNPSHLVWVTHQNNCNQPKRQHNEV